MCTGDQQSANQQLKEFTLNEADIAFQSTVYAKTTLMAGFTTVRDVGGSGVNIACGMRSGRVW
jgi:hypothetical protein